MYDSIPNLDTNGMNPDTGVEIHDNAWYKAHSTQHQLLHRRGVGGKVRLFPRWIKWVGMLSIVPAGGCWFGNGSSEQYYGHANGLLIFLGVVLTLLAVSGVVAFIADSLRFHPEDWKMAGTSVGFWVLIFGAKHAYRVHEQHKDERLADAIVAAQKRAGM